MAITLRGTKGAPLTQDELDANFTTLDDAIGAVVGGGDLLSTNNLSDVGSAAASRTNLGLEIGTDVQAHSAVLDATTASFLTADETKLDAIEALADVTDATNVGSAGAVMADGTGNDITGDLVFTEKSDHSSTPVAGKGYVWIKDTAPSSIIFTDDTGTDTTLGAAGAGIANVVEDTTPQLGGMLDVNGQAIGDGTLELLKFTETASAVNELTVTNAAAGGDPKLSASGDDVDIDIEISAKGTGTVVLTGNVVPSGTVDGRDLATDGTKLDGIEALADVTDTTNVTAAGALMDSEVDADIKTLVLPANTTISTFGATLTDDATAAAARTTLDVDQAGTDNSTDVTLAGTPNYLTIAGQVITRALINLTSHVTGILPLANGGTNASSASGARTSLGLVIGTDVQAYDVDTAKTDVAQEYSAQQNFNEATLTDAASITWDLNTQQNAKVTITASRTMAAPSNIKEGSIVHLRIIQGGTGSYTMSYNAVFKFGDAGAPTLNTAVSSVDILAFYCDGTNLQYLGAALGVDA